MEELTEKEGVFGNEVGQIFVTLNPPSKTVRSVDQIIEVLRDAVNDVPGPVRVAG